jgi:hypothetical protein
MYDSDPTQSGIIKKCAFPQLPSQRMYAFPIKSQFLKPKAKKAILVSAGKDLVKPVF